MNNILDKNQIELLKISGNILKNALLSVKKELKPGISTKELDQIAEEYIRKHGGIPSFKDYRVRGVGSYPASLCVSINDEVVHGLPNPNRLIKDGDLVSLDLGVDYRGICSDMAETVYVGECPKEIENFIKTTKESLEAGIKSAVVGNNIGAIGHTVEMIAKSEGYGVVRDLIGHGIGVLPHMDPPIPNYGNNEDGPKIREGMALAIEPMLTMGDEEVLSTSDGWTIVTADSSLAAHFEHTIIIIDGKPVIVTK